MTSSTFTHEMLRSLIDRVLRLKDEQDTLSDDIKEVYAEAKANGFDKTQIGSVVAKIRKQRKDGATVVDERDAIFDLYWDAYHGIGTDDANIDRAPAHAHEAKPAHDPETGELTEPQAAPLPVPAQAEPAPSAPATEGGAGSTAALAGSADQSDPAADYVPRQTPAAGQGEGVRLVMAHAPSDPGAIPDFLRRDRRVA